MYTINLLLSFISFSLRIPSFRWVDIDTVYKSEIK